MTEPRIKVKAMAIIRRTHEGRAQVLGCVGHDSVKNQTFYRLPGGGVEFGERTAEALHREFREEFNTTLATATQHGWIEEVFTYQGKAGHEVTALFEVTFADTTLYNHDMLTILDTGEKAAWADVTAIKNGTAILYPTGSDRYL